MKKTIIIYLLLQILFVGVLKASEGPPGNQVVTICAGSSKTLSGPAGAAGYQWFKDGQLLSTASQIVVTQAGKYQLVVTSDKGCSSEVSSAVTIQVAPIPVASIASVIQPNCTIDAGSITISPVDSATYSIDGGKTYSASNIFNNLSPGSYDIVVQNISGCSSSIVNQTLERQDPTGDFTASATTISYGSAVSFTATVPGAVTYLWTFGDGTTSTVANPQHYYYKSGTFDVSLTITTSGGCDYTIAKTGLINVGSDNYTPTPPVVVIPPPVATGPAVIFKSYPNPFSSYFYINFNSGISQTVQVVLRDMLGNIIVSKSFTAQNGNNTFELTNFPYMAKGYYLLDVTGLTINSQTKILKN